MNETKIFIHVGLHKTGTTFLQQEVFPKIPDINYQTKVDLSSHVKENKINLFSDENLDGGSYRLFSNAKQRLSIAKNLARLFPDAGIIVCLRKPDDWLYSAWKQYSLSYKAYPFEEYCKRLDPDVIKFDEYIKQLKILFKSVYVCDHRSLVLEPEKFVKDLCEYIGVEPPKFEVKIIYPSLSKLQVQTLVLFDSVIKSKTLRLILSLLIRFIRNDPNIKKFQEKKL